MQRIDAALGTFKSHHHSMVFVKASDVINICNPISFVTLGLRQLEERMASKKVSVRWALDWILYPDCLEVSLQIQQEFEFGYMCAKCV